MLTSGGGHNAGIVSEPGRPKRHYALLYCGAEDPWMVDDWQRRTTRKGSLVDNHQHDGCWRTAAAARSQREIAPSDADAALQASIM